MGEVPRAVAMVGCSRTRELGTWDSGGWGLGTWDVGESYVNMLDSCYSFHHHPSTPSPQTTHYQWKLTHVPTVCPRTAALKLQSCGCRIWDKQKSKKRIPKMS